MSDKHEEFLSELLGERSSIMPGSGSGWAKQMDVRGQHHEEEYAFAVDGKALPLDTLIPTKEGWTTMGEVVPGLSVFDIDGNICRVIRIGNIYTPNRALRLSFKNGETVVCDSDHQWPMVPPYTKHRRDRRIRVITAEDAMAYVDHYRRIGRNYWALPVARGLDLDPSPLFIDPYAFGLWLGDGHSENSRITLCKSEASDITSELINRGVVWHFQHPPSQKESISTIWLDDMNPVLRRMNVLGDKHIPLAILRGSREQRLDVLRGLMDADGTVSKTGVVTLTLSSERLINDARELLLTLGGRGNVIKAPAKYQTGVSVKFNLSFSPSFNPFGAVSHKLNDWKPGKSTGFRSLIKVEEVDPISMRCIEVDSPTHSYLVTDAFLPTHNSTFGESITVTLAMWDKAVEQSHNEIPALAFRWYGSYQLDPKLDLVCVEAQTFKAMKDCAEEYPALVARIAELEDALSTSEEWNEMEGR